MSKPQIKTQEPYRRINVGSQAIAAATVVKVVATPSVWRRRLVVTNTNSGAKVALKLAAASASAPTMTTDNKHYILNTSGNADATLTLDIGPEIQVWAVHDDLGSITLNFVELA